MSRRTPRPTIDTSALAGRTAVVTGGGSGIGRSLARLLAQRGASVHVVDRDGAAAGAVATQVAADGGRAVAHTVDVTDIEQVTGLAETVLAEGPVDLLFNNAGVGHAGAVVDTTLADWHRLIDVNLIGVVHGIHAFLPRLLDQGSAVHIMNTASMAGIVPNPGLTAYSATKAAVVGLTEALDTELADTSVRVSALCPGVIRTAIIATSTMRGDWEQRREQTMALYEKRGTSPDVVARQALAAISRGQVIVPTPRYQVVPAWVVQRISPTAGRALAGATARWVASRSAP